MFAGWRVDALNRGAVQTVFQIKRIQHFTRPANVCGIQGWEDMDGVT
jgi:hypothetical protein